MMLKCKIVPINGQHRVFLPSGEEVPAVVKTVVHDDVNEDGPWAEVTLLVELAPSQYADAVVVHVDPRDMENPAGAPLNRWWANMGEDPGFPKYD